MSISIRPLQTSELAIADQIFRLAFGTFRGHPDPATYGGDTTYMKRWFLDPSAAFAAEVDGRVVGSNFAIRWGSFAMFGPLTVHPDYWGRGVAQQLIEAAIECFHRWDIQQAGFFTFSNSPLHLHLYQKFGFSPRFLTALMSKSIEPAGQLTLPGIRYSELPEDKRDECLKATQQLTHSIYEGLDLTREIQLVADYQLGDTVLSWDEAGLASFAICHYGRDTEAGSDTCYIKFGAVRPDAKAGQLFERLIQSCETLSVLEGASRLIGGVSTARQEAYQQMLSLGFQIMGLGVAMHQPNRSAFSRPGLYVIDDWR